MRSDKTGMWSTKYKKAPNNPSRIRKSLGVAWRLILLRNQKKYLSQQGIK